MEKISYDGKEIEIIRKKIKNANLRVYPDGTIKLSVPYDSNREKIERFIHSKNLWLNQKMQEMNHQQRTRKREYVSGEDIFFNGKRYILKVILDNKAYIQKGKNKILEMHVTAKSTYSSKEKILKEFYKENLSKKIDKYLQKWQEDIGVHIDYYLIRDMKTRWGSYSKRKNALMFNLRLAQKSDEEIQYVVVHELIHALEKRHNDNFKRLLTKYFPKWEKCRTSLNEIL